MDEDGETLRSGLMCLVSWKTPFRTFSTSKKNPELLTAGLSLVEIESGSKYHEDLHREDLLVVKRFGDVEPKV